MAKMKKDDEYQPPPNTFCSFVETYFCVPNAIPDDYFCPENCEEQSYEIDVAYNQIDGKQTYSRVPKATAKEISSNLETLSNNGGVFPTAPGSDQLQSILARLFAFQMKLIRLFWWRSDEPHYRAWFADNNFPHNESTFLSYFDGFEDSLMPCTPKDFNDSHFAVPNATLIQFFKIINKTIVHYYKLHDTWKTDYISECDLINDPECFKYNAIKRNGKEYEGLENAFTDTTLSKLWTLDWVAEIEQTLNDYNLDNSPAAELLRMINALNYPVDISSPSIWHKPLTIYLNWFNQEVDFEEGHSIAAAFSQDANALDVATVSSVYVIDSAPRAALKEVK
uniref:Uncharacterized protein n=1 Tax=Plectus sambesii TaxID=2011161 RepID=A0A914XQJ3_9BILA